MDALLEAACGQRIEVFDGRWLARALEPLLGHPAVLQDATPGASAPRGGGPAPGRERADGRSRTPACGLLEPGPGETWAGADEAGRGPLAGPLVACALVAAPRPPAGVADSKVLSAARRRALFWELLRVSPDVRVAIVPPSVIDRDRIHRANLEAMAAAVRHLRATYDCLWVDGPFRLPIDGPVHQHALPDADARVACVAAASVVAKVVRDAIMVALDRHYPGYHFSAHKGYPTAEHLQALARLGPSPIHRMSFHPRALRQAGS